MKALRFSNFGDVSAVLHIEEVPMPALEPGEVLVEVHAASINPSDVKNVQGKMKQTTLPRTPGRDLAGIVVAGDKKMLGKQVFGRQAETLGLRETEAMPSLSLSRGGASGQNQSLCQWLRLLAWGLITSLLFSG